jgi:hypothetical protein
MGLIEVKSARREDQSPGDIQYENQEIKPNRIPERQKPTRWRRRQRTLDFFTEVHVIAVTLLLVVAPIFLGGLRARLHTPIPHREPLTNTREVAINHEQSTRVGFGTPPRITTKPVTIKLV